MYFQRFALFILMVYVCFRIWLQVARLVRYHTILKAPFSCYILNVSVLRHEVAYFDCSAEVLNLCLNPASRCCDPMEACAHGVSMMGMKPS